jgi:hypothetical protein
MVRVRDTVDTDGSKKRKSPSPKPSTEKATPSKEDHKKAFDRLLDDAVLGVKKK